MEFPGSFAWIDPGPLRDGELELVAPDESLLDDLMAALEHPLTQRDMPRVAQTSRQQWIDLIAKSPRGLEAGDEAAGLVPAYHFWMRRISAATGDLRIIGTINLRLSHTDNVRQIIGHIGYNVFPFARGHHYAERACRLLLPLARRQGIDPLWITCNPENAASRRTCERLGASLVEIVPIPSDHPAYQRGEREKCRYRIDLS